MRTLVAALACRNNGSRLYAKPLQLLDIPGRVSVLEHMVRMLSGQPAIAEVVFGVSVGTANEIFHEIALDLGLQSIRGDERDVLQRLIQCAKQAHGTDVFRVTSESPFTYFEAIDECWRRHVDNGNDVTVVDGLPDGCNFEIFTLDALERSHALGNQRHRSELCSLYIREHRDEFRVEVVPTSVELQRGDLRLTIDYPEDLVLCRRVYERLASHAPRIPLAEIIAVLDGTPALKALVAPFVASTKLY